MRISSLFNFNKVLPYLVVIITMSLSCVSFGQDTVTSTELEKTIQGHKGDVVVVVFWATWDKPSAKQVSELNSIYEKYKYGHIEVIGVSFDEVEKRWWRASPVVKFAKKHGITFPIFKAKDKEEISHGFNVKTIPTIIYFFGFGKLSGEFKKFIADGYTTPEQIEEDLRNCLAGSMPRSKGETPKPGQEQFPILRP